MADVTISEASEKIKENAYILSQKLHELKLREAKLHRKLALETITEQRQRIVGIRNAHDRMLRDINISCDIITKNASALVNIINKDENYIPLGRNDHKPFQQLLAASTDIIKQASSSNDSHKEKTTLNVDLTATLESIKQSNSNVVTSEKSLHACSQLHNKINNITSECEDKNTLQIMDIPKPRMRRSQLCESSFLNTFEANNISTSSQYEQIIHPHNS